MSKKSKNPSIRTSREMFDEWFELMEDALPGDDYYDGLMVWQSATEACRPWMTHTPACPSAHNPADDCGCGLDEFLRSKT